MTLDRVEIGKTVEVLRVSGSGPLRRRIMDMGVTKGATIFVRKMAPLGDPMEIKIRGYEMSIRKSDAAMIEVEYHV